MVVRAHNRTHMSRSLWDVFGAADAQEHHDSKTGREHTDWEEALWRNQGFSQVTVVPTVYRLAWLLGVRDYMEEEHRSST